MNIKKNVIGSIIAGGNVTGAENNYKDNNSVNNYTIKRVRTESAIISFIIGLLASILGSWIYSLITQ